MHNDELLRLFAYQRSLYIPNTYHHLFEEQSLSILIEKSYKSRLDDFFFSGLKYYENHKIHYKDGVKFISKMVFAEKYQGIQFGNDRILEKLEKIGTIMLTYYRQCRKALS